MDFASRNEVFDDWEVPLQRICANQERLFDDMGPFQVRLLRMGKPVFSTNISVRRSMLIQCRYTEECSLVSERLVRAWRPPPKNQ